MVTNLSNLRRPEGANRDRKRIGRGPGSGTGKTSGKGHKGQKARTGHHGIPSWFEGGQMPLQRRVPKRGFKNYFKKEYEIVNVGELEQLAETTITPEVLHTHKLIGGAKNRMVKVLGDGSFTRTVALHAHAVTGSARAKIEAAGGTVTLLAGRTPAAEAPRAAAEVVAEAPREKKPRKTSSSKTSAKKASAKKTSTRKKKTEE